MDIEVCRVKLAKDLTDIDPELKEGVLGWADPKKQVSESGKKNGRVLVEFDNGIECEVQWKILARLVSDNESRVKYEKRI